jgi:hypothetical protein
MQSDTTRQAYLDLCSQAIAERKQAAAHAMKAAQEAANGEEKSSAGDKYETARAMAQADRDRAARLWAEADDLEMQLNRVEHFPAPVGQARHGSVVVTDKAVFLLGVGLGQVAEGSLPFYAVSAGAPVAQKLLGVSKGVKTLLPMGSVTVVALL